MVKLIDFINRGDVIGIADGQLSIAPKSGKPVPSDWLYTHQSILVEQISDVVLRPIYQFECFNVGRYSARFDGLTMSFTDLKLGKDYFAIFNVSLSRKKKSGRLNGKQFNPPAQGALLKFWDCSNLPKPRRPSELYKKINNMKHYLWQAEISKGNKLDPKTLCLANVTYQQIIEALDRGALVADEGLDGGTFGALGGGNVTGHVYGALKSGSENANSHIYQGLEGEETTGMRDYGYCEPRRLINTGFNNYGISKQGGAVTSKATTPSIEQQERVYSKRQPQDQTVDEWLDDYDKEQEK